MAALCANHIAEGHPAYQDIADIFLWVIDFTIRIQFRMQKIEPSLVVGSVWIASVLISLLDILGEVGPRAKQCTFVCTSITHVDAFLQYLDQRCLWYTMQQKCFVKCLVCPVFVIGREAIFGRTLEGLSSSGTATDDTFPFRYHDRFTIGDRVVIAVDRRPSRNVVGHALLRSRIRLVHLWILDTPGFEHLDRSIRRIQVELLPMNTSVVALAELLRLLWLDGTL